MKTLAALLILPSMAASAQTQPVKISSGVMAGQLVHKVMPQYPKAAIQAHVSGSVVLHVIIGEDGLPHDITVVSGPEMLRQAWVDAVKQWVYKPYMLNGRPVPVDTTITISIQMGGDQVMPARVHLSSGEMAGRILTKTSPVFPPGAADGQHASGAVVLHAVIGRDGTVKELGVISGPAFERQPVLDAVRHWTYKPYVVNGQAVEVETTITMNLDFGG